MLPVERAARYSVSRFLGPHLGSLGVEILHESRSQIFHSP